MALFLLMFLGTGCTNGNFVVITDVSGDLDQVIWVLFLLAEDVVLGKERGVVFSTGFIFIV